MLLARWSVVVIHKMIAGRAIDEEDVKSILTKNSDTLDIEYIEKWLSEFAKIAEYEDISAKFRSLWMK